MGMVCAKIDVIVCAMADSGLPPAKIAELADVNVNIIYRMRKGYLVKLENFGRVCHALGLSSKDVIDFGKTERYRNRRKEKK